MNQYNTEISHAECMTTVFFQTAESMNNKDYFGTGDNKVIADNLISSSELF